MMYCQNQHKIKKVCVRDNLCILNSRFGSKSKNQCLFIKFVLKWILWGLSETISSLNEKKTPNKQHSHKIL